MSDYVPVYRKIIHSNYVLMERCLPDPGNIRVKPGDTIEAFTELGSSKHSVHKFDVDPAISARLFPGKLYKRGETIGKIERKTLIAPFDGVLEENAGVFSLVSEKETYTLLSGVWGQVVDTTGDISVLIKTQMTDIHMIACSGESVEGELVVFPNPNAEMQMQYLKKYYKNVYKKVLYVGDFFQKELLEMAIELKVAGILSGSSTRDLFSLAKSEGIFLGIFTGFGELPTARDVFSTLTNVSNRYIFIHGSENLLRIPMPESFDSSQLRVNVMSNSLRLLKKGLRVVVFSEDHFGWVGFVEKIGKDSIVVKFEKNDASVEVPLPNILALV